MSDVFDIKSLKGLTQDSRRVQRGYLYAAFPGAKLDGRDYIADAIQNGASAILAPVGTVLPDLFSERDVILITDENPRKRFAIMAAEFYDRQPQRVVALTGTNGKTSCVHFIDQLWQSQGINAATIGTLGMRMPGAVRSGSMTTPDAVSIHAQLADMAAAGVTHMAMEASSHGLDQYRMDGVRVSAAGFTNLSRDHLDYHKDMDEYFAAKARLFSDLLDSNGGVVLNADIEQYEALKNIADEHGVSVISYGYKAKDIKLLSVHPHPHGQTIKVNVLGAAHEIELPLVGEFQAMNVLCALGIVLSEDPNQVDQYVGALSNLNGAPGRLQSVSGHPKNAAVYVDYAHTPDALRAVLTSLRPHTQGRLVCVFGCGGNRDVGKRPAMGKIAVDLSDDVIVTDDNPRSERASDIRKDILKGAIGAQEIGDRAEAIAYAIQNLEEGDVLLIAGKGHEQGQVFADYTDPFDDCTEAKNAIEELL